MADIQATFKANPAPDNAQVTAYVVTWSKQALGAGPFVTMGSTTILRTVSSDTSKYTTNYSDAAPTDVLDPMDVVDCKVVAEDVPHTKVSEPADATITIQPPPPATPQAPLGLALTQV
jgi:hypothetical protein